MYLASSGKNMQAHRSHPFIQVLNRATLVLIVAALAACTTQEQSSVVDAATTPLSDLNLVKMGIPAVLIKAHKAPYAVPPEQSCAALDASIDALNRVLEPKPGPNNKPSPIEQGSNAVGDSAVGVLRRTVEGGIPFRGWIRKLSGAERHSKQVADAIAAGLIRRAFLKGFRSAKKCP